MALVADTGVKDLGGLPLVQALPPLQSAPYAVIVKDWKKVATREGALTLLLQRRRPGVWGRGGRTWAGCRIGW